MPDYRPRKALFNPELRRRGIYLLPNLLTTAALFSGFFAIVQAMNGRFEVAAVAIFIAMVFDGLDGRVARLTRSHPRIRRGASVRAAISIAELSAAFLAQDSLLADAIQSAVGMALPTRIEVEREADSERSHQAEVMNILMQIVQQALAEGDTASKKT